MSSLKGHVGRRKAKGIGGKAKEEGKDCFSPFRETGDPH